MNTDLDQIGRALGRVPSGCSILTAQHSGCSTGKLASWVQQCSFEPPMVTVCVKRGRPILELIDGSKRFVLSVVGEDPTTMFRHFGKGFALDQDAFAGVETSDSEFGPVLSACIAHLGCVVKDRVSAGDHELFLAEVKAEIGRAHV